MKKQLTLLAIIIGFNINAQISTNGTDNSGTNASAMGRETEASGDYSTAMGALTTASGYGSTAMGRDTEASGNYATAMGRSTTASGNYSTAMGYITTASGVISTAMGAYTTSSDWASTVIGQYNSSGTSATSATSFSTAAPAFVIGNGTASDARSDAFKVFFNGDTTAAGSVTATSFIGDGSQLSNLPSASIAFDDLTSTPTTLDGYGITDAGTGILSAVTEGSNTGVRLSTSNAANHGDIGSNAVDLSYQEFGGNRGATGPSSIAMGYATTAIAYGSIAMGYGAKASGYASTAMGEFTEANGMNTLAMGNNTEANGSRSTALGSRTIAGDFASVVIGQYNSSGSTATSATSFSSAAPAFVIGNGEDSDNKSDAFKVLFNGDTTVSNDLTVSGDVVISSDARLKANIISLGATLSKLLLIDGKSYTMKKNGKQKIGVLAQDIQKVFPELVSTDDNDMLTVNYQGLVPVLINALKEQDKKFKEQEDKMKVQEDKMKSQEKRLERLEKLVAQLD